MDHEISIKEQAAEKYLLGELSPAEREAFEQHYFECPECAEEVRLGFQFGENAKAVFRQEPLRVSGPVRPPKRREWSAWFRPAMLAPMAAGLAIVAFSGYQNTVQIPALEARVEQMQRSQVLSSAVLAPSARSSAPAISIPHDAQFFQLSLAIAAVAPAGQYRCELRSGSGPIATVPVPKLDPETNLTLLVPTAGFSTGDYDAVLVGVTGGKATEIEHYRFAVR